MSENNSFNVSTYSLLNHWLVERCTRIDYIKPATEHVFGYDHSYIVFDYNGMDVTLPSGEIVNNPKAYLHAPRQNYIHYTKPANSGFIIFILKPTAFYRITKSSLDQKNSKLISLNNIFGKELTEELYNYFENEQDITKVLNTFIEVVDNQFPKWQEPTPICDIISETINDEQELSVDKILELFPYSQSTLNRNFKKYIGLTPGVFLRLSKFRKLIQCLHRKNTSLQDLIYQFNYYDQSHCTKDFKTFAGITPSEYKGPNYKMLHKVYSLIDNNLHIKD